MVKINFTIDKEVNFFMILYQKLKGQNNFENLNFKNIEDFEKSDKDEIKRILRNNENIIESIQNNQKLKRIYDKNIEMWNDYWFENLNKLKKIKEELKQKVNNYDLSVFEKVANFFRVKPPENIRLFICIGNESNKGTGNAISPDIIVLFPRSFKDLLDKNIDADFGVLIHEIMHLHQNICQGEEDKELIEQIARCFAPKGILINEEKNKENLEVFNLVKQAFNNNKNYKDLKEEIKNKQSKR